MLIFTAVAEVHSLDEECKSVTLRLDLLAFITGADQIPPSGFDGIPQIQFLHGNAILPTACTCTPAINLPSVFDDSYSKFRESMVEGIVSGYGFGCI